MLSADIERRACTNCQASSRTASRQSSGMGQRAPHLTGSASLCARSCVSGLLLGAVSHNGSHLSISAILLYDCTDLLAGWQVHMMQQITEIKPAESIT